MITVAVDAQVSRSMFVCREKEPAPLNGAKVDQRLHTRVKELERPRHNSDMSWWNDQILVPYANRVTKTLSDEPEKL